MMENNIMQLKAYKMLAEIQRGMLGGIRHKTQNAVEYKLDKPEELKELVGYIANPAKWEYCGLLDNKDKAVLEVLEYLLNDDQKQVNKYRSFNPTQP